MEEVRELKAVIPCNLREAVRKPVDREAADQGALVPRRLRAPGMRPDVQHPAACIIAATVFDILCLGTGDKRKQFFSRIGLNLG
jgi:hypothetical protein